MPVILCAIPEETMRRVFNPALLARLEAMGEVVYCPDAAALDPQEYERLWERADFALTGWGVRPPAPETLDRAGRLRAICHTAGSVRMIPRRALERGIVVTTARAAIARTVSEYCLCAAIMLLRGFAADVGRSGANETLYNKPVGLIGFGCVGREFRRLLEPFGCPVSVLDPYLSAAEAESCSVVVRDLESVLSESRILSLHAPDVPATRGMIGARELALMPDGAILINSARGRLVDTDALTESVRAGRIRAALDVTDPEPLPQTHPLRSLPGVFLTPHVAGPTTDDLPRLAEMALDDLERLVQGREPLHPVTLEAYDRMSF